jgi:SAM-dependent methyltransferase
VSNDQQRDQTGQHGGAGEAARFWDDHYRQHDQPWSGDPNAFLVDVVARRRPGTALELGCGDGGDAIWLAGRGWRVTAVDIAAVALRRLAERAIVAGVGDRVVGERHDLARTFPSGSFDLVAALYLHTPFDFPRARVLQAAARAVAPGGHLLIVEHASVAPWSWNQDRAARFPTPEEILDSLDLDRAQWQIERLAAPARVATGPGGQSATVTDNVIAIRRV